MSVIELEPESAVTAPAYSAARPVASLKKRITDNTLTAATGLVVTDAALLALPLVLASSPLMAIPFMLMLISAYTAAGLYPGFGLHSPERLRRRWLLGAPVALLALAYSWQAAAAVTLYLALSPLAEAFTRHLLYRLQRWGKPAQVVGQGTQTLLQNWYLGLIPADKASTLVLFQGAKPQPGQSKAAEAFLLQEGGSISRIRPLDNKLVRWLGTSRAQNPNLAPYKTCKRIIDVTGSLLLLTLTAPIIALCLLTIYVTDPGPVIYTQFRRSQFGNPIRIYKLRSMYQDSGIRLEHILSSDADAADSWFSRFKLQPDPRVLPFIGGFIRTFSIDELPQLINVLSGEMSLIGPRVFVDYDLEVYPPELLKLRQSVPAGLTGLWQVSVRSHGDNADKVRYDATYVRTWSLWQDIDILYRTVGAVLTGRGAG